MITPRGRRLLVLAALLYLTGWAFGTEEIYPVAVGLAAAVAIAAVWIRLMARPMRLVRRTRPAELTEGRAATVALELRTESGPLPGSAAVVERVSGLGERRAHVARAGHVLRGQYVLTDMPRGRYTIDGAQVVVSDPFGLAEAQLPAERTDTLLVYPRVYELDGVFTDAGAAGDSTQTMLHRQSGYDLHSIRDFQEGESLRRVHWRSTAKRRRLMVKELRDAPRDEAAILLDCDARAVAGTAPESSFDAQVRVAASLLRHMTFDGQRTSLVIHGRTRTRVRVAAGGGEWAAALGELAAVRPSAERPLVTLLAEALAGGGGEALDAARVYVVTAALGPALAERLRAMRSGRRDIAVAWVDAPSFAGVRAAAGAADAAALSLARAGVPLVRVRAGDDLAAVLSSPRLLAAHA